MKGQVDADAYRTLLAQLTGQNSARPRLQAAHNLWRKDSRIAIEKETRRRADAGGIAAKRLAPVREKVVLEIYEGLSQQAKAYWEQKAKSEHEQALEKWESQMKGPASKDPAHRQRCIQALVQFVQPILDGIAENTGWDVTMLAGGPEPIQGGSLAMLSIHSSTSNVGLDFRLAKNEAYKRHIVPAFSQLLHKSFTVDECRKRSLDDDGEFQAIAHTTFSETAEVHSVASQTDYLSDEATEETPVSPVRGRTMDQDCTTPINRSRSQSCSSPPLCYLSPRRLFYSSPARLSVPSSPDLLRQTTPTGPTDPISDSTRDRQLTSSSFENKSIPIKRHISTETFDLPLTKRSRKDTTPIPDATAVAQSTARIIKSGNYDLGGSTVSATNQSNGIES